MTGPRECVVLPGGAGVALSAAVCAELLTMVRSPVRGALAPVAAEAAALIEQVGRTYRWSDAGPIQGPRPEPGSRSLRDPIDVPAAAALLAYSPRHVRRLARDGRLPGRDDLGSGWTFERSAVLRYAAER